MGKGNSQSSSGLPLGANRCGNQVMSNWGEKDEKLKKTSPRKESNENEANQGSNEKSDKQANPNQSRSSSNSSTSPSVSSAALIQRKLYLQQNHVEARFAKSAANEGDVGDLPQNEVARRLGIQAFFRLRSTCARLYTSLEAQGRFRKFIHHVVNHEPAKVRAMLDAHPELLFEMGEITDPGGVFKEPMSAWQHVHWAGDINLKQEFQKRIDARVAAGNTDVLKLANEQRAALEARKDKPRGKRWDPNAEGELLYAYNAYIDAYDKMKTNRQWDDNKLDKLWLAVGLAQARAPRHYILEMCLPNCPFHPIPNFEDKQDGDLPPAECYDYDKKDMCPLMSAGGRAEGLGDKFSLTRGGSARAQIWQTDNDRFAVWGCGVWRRDRDAFAKLIKVRFKQFESLISEVMVSSLDIGHRKAHVVPCGSI